MSYEFCINVGEGKPGFSDSGGYTSDKYKSFKDVYGELVGFNIRRHWPHLRSVQNMSIRRDGGVWINSFKEGRYKIWLCDLSSLGLTEAEFDVIADFGKQKWSGSH